MPRPGAQLVQPTTIVLGTTDTEVIAELTASDGDRAYVLAIANTSSQKALVDLHMYDADAAESPEQANAIFGLWQRPLGPRGEEVLTVGIPLTEGMKISGKADAADAITINIFPMQI